MLSFSCGFPSYNALKLWLSNLGFLRRVTPIPKEALTYFWAMFLEQKQQKNKNVESKRKNTEKSVQ